jgi:hypothetical protein
VKAREDWYEACIRIYEVVEAIYTMNGYCLDLPVPN